MKKVPRIEFVLNEREFALICKCLVYCLHRYTEHPQSGITKAIKLEQLKVLLKDIELLK